MNVVRNGLAQIESELEPDIDLVEGNEGILITGCVRAYRQAVMRRVLDLAQSFIVAWNAGFPVGAVVCARSLLETIATFHSFLRRAEALAAEKQWTRIGELVDAYAFMTSSGPDKGKTTEQSPPRIGKVVRDFIAATEPGKEELWDQISDTAHPNGKRMMESAGILKDKHFVSRASSDSEPLLFSAVFNAHYSCCWLIQVELDFDILLAVIRSGDELPPDHPLIVQRRQLDELTSSMSTIACLGWGSLVWDPRDLQFEEPWFFDGPNVQVEFLRKSKNKRITLVLDASAAPVPSCWVKMAGKDVTAAVASLRAREDTSTTNIGVWKIGDPSPGPISNLPKWAASHGMGVMIWTNLPRQFGELERPATADEVIARLSGLIGEERDRAEEYVRRAPRQIDTAYRQKIAEALGWVPVEQ
jgi:hypothetical protein